MSSTTRIPAVEVTGPFGAVVKAVARRKLGLVPDSLGVMWQHRPVMMDMMSFGGKTEKWHELDLGLSTLATMAAAATVGCSFCLDLHYFMAHDRGLDEDKAREVPIWRDSTRFTRLERLVMEYAEAMSQTPPAVTDELSDALLAEIGAPRCSSSPPRSGTSTPPPGRTSLSVSTPTGSRTPAAWRLWRLPRPA